MQQNGRLTFALNNLQKQYFQNCPLNNFVDTLFTYIIISSIILFCSRGDQELIGLDKFFFESKHACFTIKILVEKCFQYLMRKYQEKWDENIFCTAQKQAAVYQ